MAGAFAQSGQQSPQSTPAAGLGQFTMTKFLNGQFTKTKFKK
jgi:hypothetical protein